MPSQLAWLDTSAEQQRQVRELIKLYAQPESRDELGIGQFRDVLSEAMFPGTSVLQTRARYYLFIPWSFREAARTRSGDTLRAWADREQRELIKTLKELPELGRGAGLIGARAGASVKILPSMIFWPALVKYGILASDLAPDQLGKAATALVEDELAERHASDWHPTLPTRPEGFPQALPDGFDLTRAEAGWLRERMLSATSGTLLEHLLLADRAPDDSDFPWLDSVCLSAQGEPGSWLSHARFFSTCMHGAALLYNLLLGELYADKGLGDGEDFVGQFREALDTWSDELDGQRGALGAWDRADFWHRIVTTNPRIGPRTRLFVATWLDAVVEEPTRSWADDERLRELVKTVEQHNKEAQSRFSNERLLRSWSGQAGTNQLAYRWGNVSRIVTDIHEGLERADA